jgi:hypothetical protein
MKRLAAWIGGVVSGVMAYRLFKSWRSSAPAPTSAPAAEETDDRAEELRAKLAESRGSEEPSPTEPASGGPSESPESPESLDERRRRVHEEGRAAIDRMNDN